MGVGQVPKPTRVSKQAESRERGRRQFTTEQKYRILAAANACRGVGEVAALLRRERIYASYLHNWRNQAKKAGLVELAEGRSRTDPPTHKHDAALSKLCRLRRHLEKELQISRGLLALQVTARELLDTSVHGPRPESVRECRPLGGGWLDA
jgi:transposase